MRFLLIIVAIAATVCSYYYKKVHNNKITKIIAFSCITILFISVAVGIFIPTADYEFKTGRDTHAAFGNAEYQLLSSNYNDTRQLTLYNCKYKSAIIDDVTSYKEKDNKVYFCSGKFIYAVLVINTNKLYYYQEEGKIYFPPINQMIDDRTFIILNEFNQFDADDQQMLNLLAHRE